MKRLGPSRQNSWGVSIDHISLVRPPHQPKPVNLVSTPQNVTFDLSRSAIIVVDMQNDFCHPDGWLASIGVDIAPARAPIQPLADLLPVLRAHSVPIIWVNWGNRHDRLNLSPALLHVYDPDGQSTGLGGALPKTGGAVLEEGSWNAAIVDGLEADPHDIHVAKYRMSGFWDTPLDSILRNLRVDTVMFTGVNLDQCVMATLQDANFLGYDCILLEDCSATTSPEFCHAATIYNVRQCFGVVTNSTSLREGIDGADWSGPAQE